MSDNKPHISILMPYYNAEKTLCEALDSINAQSFKNYELIAVDDGSTDFSYKIIKEKSISDNRIRIVKPGRIGFVNSLNYGLSLAKAPLVARMDADDFMLPERLRLQWEYLDEKSNTVLVSSKVKLFSESTIQNGYIKYINWQNSCLSFKDISNNLYYESPFVHPSVMFRKDIVLKHNGYYSGNFPEDYELWLRLFSFNYTMSKLDKILLYWRIHENRLTNIDSRYSKEAFDNIRFQYLLNDKRIINILDNRIIIFWGAGRLTRKRIKPLINNGIIPGMWVDVDEKKIGRFYNNVKVFHYSVLSEYNFSFSGNKPFIFVFVKNHGAGEKIKMFLEQNKYKIGDDFIFIG